MKVSMSANAKDLVDALQLYAKASLKEEVFILNKAGFNFAKEVRRLTPRAKGPRIRAELKTNKLAIKILAARGAFRGKSFEERGAIVERFINARARSAQYIAVAGWANARRAFGVMGGSVNPRSQAARGFGVRASIRQLRAVLANDARGADRVALDAADQALGEVAKDMGGWATERMQRIADKYSAK